MEQLFKKKPIRLSQVTNQDTVRVVFPQKWIHLLQRL